MTDFNIWKGLWHPQLMPLPLTTNEIHVWYALVHQLSSRQALWEQLLSAAERERASRMLLPAARAQFIVGRGLLREILAGYLSEEPASLCFDYGSRGKPRLRSGKDLHFNLSHSADLLVVAVRRGDEVGIDAEKIRPVDEKKLAAQFLTETENNWLAESPALDRSSDFFQMWTAKESFLKACGADLDSFKSVELPLPLAFPAVITVDSLSSSSVTCNLVKMETLPDYACTLAIVTPHLV
jgi:4'-phosphopantetheinyl transferase